MRNPKLTRRDFLRVAAASAVGSAAVACVPAAAPSETDSMTAGASPDEAPTEVQFVNIWTANDTPFIIELLEEWDETHPQYELTLIQTTNRESTQKLQTLVSAGTPPDCGYWAPGAFIALAPAGAFLALDSYIERDADIVQIDDFPELSIKGASVDGVMYGIPWSINIQAFVSVPVLYDEAGVPHPDWNTWTWQDFGETAPLIATGEFADKKVALANQQRYFVFMWAWGGDVLDAGKDQQPILDSDSNLEALTFLKSLYEADVVLTGEYGEAFGGLRPMLASGRIAHAIHGIGTWNFMMREAVVDWDFWHVPAGPAGRAAEVIPISFQVVNGSENPEGGWELVRWITDPSHAGRVFAENLQSPARYSLREHFVEAALVLAPHATILPTLIDYGHVRPDLRLPFGGEIGRAVSSELFQPAVENSDRTIAEGIEIAQQKLEEIFAERS